MRIFYRKKTIPLPAVAFDQDNSIHMKRLHKGRPFLHDRYDLAKRGNSNGKTPDRLPSPLSYFQMSATDNAGNRTYVSSASS